ncbi:MAG: YihY/virulence factor BrkB family protein [Verrucomicrobiota bacterium]|nr:YihY/virulence factor BrkB family protein [Verrucomicrobiota bacterium]
MKKKLKELFDRCKKFISKDLWVKDFSELSKFQTFCHHVIRMFVIAVKGAIRDKLPLHASSLSFISILSLIPVLALSFSVSKGLGVQAKLMKVIEGRTFDLPAGVADMLKTIFEYASKTDFSAMGSVGLIFLFVTVLKVMGSIEQTFNTVWAVKSPRTIMRKFSDYVSILFVVPILLLASTGINATLSSEKITSILQEKLGAFFWIYQQMLSLTGLLSLIIAFSFLYMFMPNTKVKLSSAYIGGLFGALLWLLTQNLYIRFQIGVSNANAIYGTFASVPLFLAWTYMSWLIVLVGAEIAFSFQNRLIYTDKSIEDNFSYAMRWEVATIVLYDICKHFHDGTDGWLLEDFHMNIHFPNRLVSMVVNKLKEAGLICEVSETEHQKYIPARDLDHLTLADVETAYRGTIHDSMKCSNQSGFYNICKTINNEYGIYEKKMSNITFRDLICAEKQK